MRVTHQAGQAGPMGLSDSLTEEPLIPQGLHCPAQQGASLSPGVPSSGAPTATLPPPAAAWGLRVGWAARPHLALPGAPSYFLFSQFPLL